MGKQIIFVEGNIAAGKTTLLRRLVTVDDLRGKIATVEEPIDDFRYELDEFNRAPNAGSAYALQVKIIDLIEIILQLINRSTSSRIPVLERSTFSAVNIFSKLLYDSDLLSIEDYSHLRTRHDAILEKMSHHTLNFVYLVSSPSRCAMQAQQRGRPEEANLTLEYLTAIHEAHESEFARLGEEYRVLRIPVSPEMDLAIIKFIRELGDCELPLACH